MKYFKKGRTNRSMNITLIITILFGLGLVAPRTLVKAQKTITEGSSISFIELNIAKNSQNLSASITAESEENKISTSISTTSKNQTIKSVNKSIGQTSPSNSIMARPSELPASLWKGEKVFLLGGSGSTGFLRDIWSSAGNLSNWSNVSPNVPWLGNNFCVAYFNGKIFAVVPWFNGPNNVNQVYSSNNGVNWSLVQSSAPFSYRNSYSCAVYNNRLWLAGGQELNTNIYKNDVWSTGDGINWTESTASALWPARGEHNLVNFQNKLWILAGNTGGLNMLGDVWYSTDGINWTQPPASIPWEARMDTSVVVGNNKLWVLGGLGQSLSYLSDVWSTVDGINWIHVDTDSMTAGIQDAPWAPRGYHQSMTFGGKMWVLGGNDSMGNLLNDVWYSTNGNIWIQSTASAGWLPRFGHQVVVTPANFGHSTGNFTYNTLDINAIQ